MTTVILCKWMTEQRQNTHSGKIMRMKMHSRILGIKGGLCTEHRADNFHYLARDHFENEEIQKASCRNSSTCVVGPTDTVVRVLCRGCMEHGTLFSQLFLCVVCIKLIK